MESAVTDILKVVSKIDGKVDMLIVQGGVQDDRHAQLEARVRIVEKNAEFDARLRSVENKQYWFSGAAAAVGGLLGWAGTIFSHPIK